MLKIKNTHFDFLNELKENNNREWFNENKERYLVIKKEIELFWNHLFWELNSFDEFLQNPWEKSYMFRIYRDARFAKWKPYKTNYWLLISPWWKPMMHSKSWYFLNLEPGNSFLVWWIWRPESSLLKSLRNSIDNNSTEIKKIINNKKLKEAFTLSWDKVKTAPRWYKKDHIDIELLKHKDFYVIHKFTDKEILSESFFKDLVWLCKVIYPLWKYLNMLK